MGLEKMLEQDMVWRPYCGSAEDFGTSFRSRCRSRMYGTNDVTQPLEMLTSYSRLQRLTISIDHSDADLFQDTTTGFLYVLIRQTSFPPPEDMTLDVPGKYVTVPIIPQSTTFSLPRLSLTLLSKVPIRDRVTALAIVVGCPIKKSPF